MMEVPDLKTRIENLERNIAALDNQYRIVDCKFIQDSYMKQRDRLTDKLLALKKLLTQEK